MLRLMMTGTAVLMLAGCQPPAGPGEATPPSEPSPAPSPTGLALQAMVFDEFSEAIEPGLGCSLQNADNGVLFVANGADDTAHVPEGAFKVDDRIWTVTRTEGGGFDALVTGGTFRNAQGMEVRINRGPGEGERQGIETTVWPAEMIVTLDGEGGTTTVKGTWGCGA